MSFDWIRFFTSYNIEYVTAGPNVSKGNVNIRCPFCAHEDPSHHMGVNLQGRGWACWRRSDHRGKNPVRLIRVLLGCSVEQARRIIGSDISLPEDFKGQVNSLMGLNQDSTFHKSARLELPKEFHSFKDLPSARPFISYLQSRNYSRDEILQFTKLYDIYYSTRGPYKGRIIFPVYYRGKLVSWTGRTIYKNEMLRYKSLTTKVDKAEKEGVTPASRPVSHFLLWYDKLISFDAHTLILTEGPFDALRAMTYGKDEGIVSTCFFTNTPTMSQVELLHELIPKFNDVFLLLDQGTVPQALRILAMLTGLNIKLLQLPKQAQDPAELTRKQLKELVKCVM